jgi:hypothetical protein
VGHIRAAGRPHIAGEEKSSFGREIKSTQVAGRLVVRMMGGKMEAFFGGDRVGHETSPLFIEGIGMKRSFVVEVNNASIIGRWIIVVIIGWWLTAMLVNLCESEQFGSFVVVIQMLTGNPLKFIAELRHVSLIDDMVGPKCVVVQFGVVIAGITLVDLMHLFLDDSKGVGLFGLCRRNINVVENGKFGLVLVDWMGEGQAWVVEFRLQVGEQQAVELGVDEEEENEDGKEGFDWNESEYLESQSTFARPLGEEEGEFLS